VGGLLAFVGVLVLLANLPHSGTRFWGLLLSAAALALGGFAAWRWRGRPAASAGVALAALSVVPFFVFAFVDPKRPGRTFSSLGHAKNILTGILLLAAVVWLVAYLWGPGRRFAFYLGAAMASAWLVVLLQVGVKSTSARNSSIARPSSPVVPSNLGRSGGSVPDSRAAPATTNPFSSDSSSDTSSDSFSSDPFGSDSTGLSSDPFGSSSFDSDPFNSSYSSNSDPFGSTNGTFTFGDLSRRSPIGSATTTGLLSFLIGAAYAIAGTRLDRRGDSRTGTPFFAVASAALPVGIILMGSGSLHAKPAEVLAVLTGVAFLWAGTRGGRRFSSWYGGYGVLAGVSALVADIFRHHPVPAGLVLVALGAATAVAADLLTDRIEGSGGGFGRRLRPFPEPGGPTPTGSAWPAPEPQPVQPWPAQPWPAQPSPGAPPLTPPQAPPPERPWGPVPTEPSQTGPGLEPPPPSQAPFPPPGSPPPR